LKQGYPFFNYASSYWSDHMKQLDAEVQRAPRVKSTFLYLAQNKCRMQLAWKHFRHANTHGFQRKQLTMVTNYGLANLIQFLVDDWADANAQRGGYDSALYVAAAEGHVDIVRLLAERGAGVNAQGGRYGNALQAAALNGHTDIVRYLGECGADVNAQGGECGYALQAAAVNGSQDIVRYLVEQGANVNAQGGRYGNALLAAVNNGNQDISGLQQRNSGNQIPFVCWWNEGPMSTLRAADTVMPFWQLRQMAREGYSSLSGGTRGRCQRSGRQIR
jgi:hypothetical protein